MSETKSIVVERLMPHPAERIWRALTTPELLREFLMDNDIAPVVGHRFSFRAKPWPGWSGVTHCEVTEVDPPRRLAYRFGDGTESDSGLKTLVTWTLTEQEGGTLVRMEHSGFRPEDEDGFQALSGGWPKVLGGLERVAGQ
jgi:uncharacterized protein YndB with AHSA1/START domain